MATSGTASFLPDLLTIVQEACERASVDFTGPYALRSAKRSLDLLSMSWANKGVNLWTIDEQELPLAQGAASFDLPADTVDMVYPSIRIVDNGVNRDLPITREDFADYASIPVKSQPGRPSVIFVHRLATQPRGYVWQVPDSNGYTLVWWRLRRMQDTGASTNNLDLPFRAVPAMTSGLAYHLALKKPIKDLGLVEYLRQGYEKDLSEFMAEDRDKSSTFLAPYTD